MIGRRHAERTPGRRHRLALRTTTALAGLAFAAMLPAAAALAANTYGLVIGVDDYLGVSNDLQGAVNDAEDIHATLVAAGAIEVVLLTNSDATKATIQSTWFRLVDAAQAGDTLVFSYAGHGSQEPEPPGRNGEADGKNENFLLAGYSPSGPGEGERIVDDEMFEWLKAADDKGIEVVFIADSCHSGTMTRGGSSRVVRYRNGNFRDPDIATDILTLPPPAFATASEEDFNFVTFVGATQENRLTPEIMIDGKPRGALSWAFSRAMEGAADTNHDGALSQQELLAYLVPTVETQAENQQIPQVVPLRADTKPIIGLSRGANLGSPVVTPVAVDPGLPPPPLGTPPVAANPGLPPPPGANTIAVNTLVRVFISGSPSALPVIPGVTFTPNEAEADLTWDVTAGTVIHHIGGLVAENVTQAGISAILSKWAAIGFIKAHTAVAPLLMGLPSGNQTYKVGEIAQVTMTGANQPYLTMFNLAPDGRVELFIPGSPAAPRYLEESQTDWRGRTLSEQLRVAQPPYGAEHLVAILTEEPATALHAALASMGSAGTASGLSSALQQLLDGKNFQAGILPIYTTGTP